MTKILIYENQRTFFEQEFTNNEICQYDPNYFLFNHVQNLATKANIKIEYLSDNFQFLRHKMGDYAFFIRLEQVKKNTKVRFNKNDLYWVNL